MITDLSGKLIKIGESKYRVIKQLNQGTHSVFYTGYCDDLNIPVTIKHLSIQKTEKISYESYVKEVAILEEIGTHQNIIKLIGK